MCDYCTNPLLRKNLYTRSGGSIESDKHSMCPSSLARWVNYHRKVRRGPYAGMRRRETWDRLPSGQTRFDFRLRQIRYLADDGLEEVLIRYGEKE